MSQDPPNIIDPKPDSALTQTLFEIVKSEGRAIVLMNHPLTQVSSEDQQTVLTNPSIFTFCKVPE